MTGSDLPRPVPLYEVVEKELVRLDRRQRRRCDICGADATHQCGHIGRDGVRCSVRDCDEHATKQPRLCPEHADRGQP